MRCTYCRPEFDFGADPPALDRGDLVFLVGHLHGRFGLRKLRLTGGEPTTRRDLPEIVDAVAGLGVKDVAMTTNGLTLTRQARTLHNAGLRRVNVSVDTLDAHRFTALTGVDGVDRVLAGIDAALAAGLAVKLNAVVVRGQNEVDLMALLRYAASMNLTLRLIELMPMGPLASAWGRRYVSEAQMRNQLERDGVRRFVPLPGQSHRSDAARLYRAELDDGGTATVGFITPMSEHFCDDCDRLRLTADGEVYPCLMDAPRGNVTDAVRRRDPGAIDAVLNDAYGQKADAHPPTGPAIMTHLGG